MTKPAQQKKYFSFEEIADHLKDEDKGHFMSLLEDGSVHARGRFFDPDAIENPQEALPSGYKAIDPLTWRDFWMFWTPDKKLLLYRPNDQGRYLEIEIPAVDLQHLKMLKQLVKANKQKAKKASPVKKQCAIHEAIGLVIAHLKNKEGAFPSAAKVWQHIEDNYNNEDWNCDIISVSADTIEWKHLWSKNSVKYLNKRTFTNVVSQYKKDKKPLPII